VTPTTRYLCPLCDWHHDQPEARPTMPPPGVSIPEHAEQTLMTEYTASETVIREHLETHPLIEWARKVASLQRNLAGAKADVQLAMDEWGKSDRHHAEKSVAMAAERGAWGTTRTRVWNAAFIADEDDVTDWQRGYRACSVRVMAALDEPVDSMIYDFNAPLRTPATPEDAPLRTPATASRRMPDKAATSEDAPDKGGEQP
jgi:hypothetical protein